ncbi:MAG: helix-turn-helix domain-containing protein [Lacrimispora sp.]
MKSQITMKDMARHFGVSLNTIHKAIAGKPGVSEETRKKILSYADANGYKLNTMASFLKRKD